MVTAITDAPELLTTCDFNLSWNSGMLAGGQRKMSSDKMAVAMYGISRIDDEEFRTHAWRVSLRRHRIRHVRNFADKKCGGKRKALLLAKAYRDDLLRQNPPLSRREFSGIRRRNNQTGVVGVCRYSKSYTLKDGTVRHCWYWEAIWPTTRGASEIARFSVNKFGEAGAFDRACAARNRGFKLVKGVFWPCEPSATIVSEPQPIARRLRSTPDRHMPRLRSGTPPVRRVDRRRARGSNLQAVGGPAGRQPMQRVKNRNAATDKHKRLG